MSLSLTKEALQRILEDLEKLEAAGLDVRQFKSGMHYVFVEKVVDQMEGDHYIIRGITQKEPPSSPITYREALGPGRRGEER